MVVSPLMSAQLAQRLTSLYLLFPRLLLRRMPCGAQAAHAAPQRTTRPPRPRQQPPAPRQQPPRRLRRLQARSGGRRPLPLKPGGPRMKGRISDQEAGIHPGAYSGSLAGPRRAPRLLHQQRQTAHQQHTRGEKGKAGRATARPPPLAGPSGAPPLSLLPPGGTRARARASGAPHLPRSGSSCRGGTCFSWAATCVVSPTGQGSDRFRKMDP